MPADAEVLAWPPLPYADWQDTCLALHLYLQIAGKVRLALSPHLNHFWEATFYLTPRGLTSGAIPMPGGEGIFSIQFDFLGDRLEIATSHGNAKALALRPCSVADFEQEVLDALRRLGIEVEIWPVPVEMSHTVRFDQDHQRRGYDAAAVRRWWRILIAAQRVFEAARAGYVGKCSPVHLFWGSMDLALTRFSGRRAPDRPEADRVTRLSYSHELASVGFWAGDERFPEPAFYAYAAPAPAGFAEARLSPPAAFYDTKLGEFLLRYDDVRLAPDPAAALSAFVRSSYEAAANLGGWDRAALEDGTQ